MKIFEKYMPVTLFCLALLTTWASGIEKAAASQDCIEKVRAMHKGAWNPFTRTPHRSVRTEYDSAGKVLLVWDNIVQSPLRTISGIRNQGPFALVIDNKAWTGPSLEGPWTSTQDLPAGRKENLMRLNQSTIDGIHSAECAQTVVLDGKNVEKYTFKIKTAADKKQGGLWLADTNTIFFDPAAQQIVRWEKTEMQSSWAPKPSQNRHITEFDYDPNIKVEAPK